MGGPSTPPGWYDDGQGNKRWWDGSGWTERLENDPASANPAAQPLGTQRPNNPRAEAKAAQAYAKASRPWFKKKRWWAVAVVVILFVAVGLGGGGDDDTPATVTDQTQTDTQSKAASPSDSASESEPVEEAEPTEKAEPSPEPKPEPKPEPEFTASQQNAIDSAEGYLEFKAFSRLGLIEQLASEYGDQFPVKDAVFAVDHITVSWNNQAVRAAKDYLDFQSFSRQGLIDQLSS